MTSSEVTIFSPPFLDFGNFGYGRRFSRSLGIFGFLLGHSPLNYRKLFSARETAKFFQYFADFGLFLCFWSSYMFLEWFWILV